MITTIFSDDPRSGISYFKFAKLESMKSTFRCRVGACIVVGKSVIAGHNKGKTHPRFANPNLHLKTSLHAELDCLSKADKVNGATIYVYRETADGKPALARPCEHCMEFLRKSGISKVYYTTSKFPYWESENVE